MNNRYMSDYYGAINLVGKMLDTETRIQGVLPKAKSGCEGNATKLPQNVWFSSVFFLNEMEAIRERYDKVVTDPQILFNWENEFGGNRNTNVNVGNSIRSGIVSVGTRRTQYRKGCLFSNQQKPFLISLRYCNKGHPVMDGRKKYRYLDVDTIRELCVKLKIADPRFFSSRELTTLREAAIKKGELISWGFPSTAQYEELEKTALGSIYGKHSVYVKNHFVKRDP